MVRVGILFIGSIFIFLLTDGFIKMGLWLVFVMCYVIASELIDHFKKLRSYENRYEHIYVISNSRDGDVIWFDDYELDSLIVRADFEKVMLQVKEEKKWLERSRNDFYIGEGLSERNRLQVVPIIFKDGEFINESWGEFRERVRREVMESRKQRHKQLRKAGLEYYHRNMNFQKGI